MEILSRSCFLIAMQRSYKFVHILIFFLYCNMARSWHDLPCFIMFLIMAINFFHWVLFAGCQSYVYDSKISSVVSEFDLACGDQNLLPSLSISAYWVAFLISCFISGALSDRFGRKYVSLTLIICFAVATSLTPLANDIYTYIGLRFACGFCAISSYLDYIIMAEMMDKNKLSMIGMTVEGSVLK